NPYRRSRRNYAGLAQCALGRQKSLNNSPHPFGVNMTTPKNDQHASLERRRQFIKLSGMFTAMGALPLLQMHNKARAAEPDAPLRIGYLPITDATPLLVAHHNGYYQDQGLEVEKPRLF